MEKGNNMIFEEMVVNSTKVIKIILGIFLPYIMIKARCLKISMRTYAIIMDWLDIRCVSVVCQNILWICIKFHLKNKISNIALVEANVDINNALVEVNSIISIDALNLNVSDLFNNPDEKINHLNWCGVLRLDSLWKKRMYVCLIVFLKFDIA